jgi:prepilin-type N-terminal cleavage/methylation domain-containing protein
MRTINSRQAGFTIVELMIVIMIIGVLAALVLPGVRANAVRAKMSEAILALSPCRNAVTEAYQSGGDLPVGNWGCEASDVSIYVDFVTVNDFGVIKASLRGFNDGRIDTHDITLAPLDNTGNVPSGAGAVITSWRCGSPLDTTQPVPPQYLPGSCRG